MKADVNKLYNPAWSKISQQAGTELNVYWAEQRNLSQDRLSFVRDFIM